MFGTEVYIHRYLNPKPDLAYDATNGPVPVNERGYRVRAPTRGAGKGSNRLFSPEDDEELVR